MHALNDLLDWLNLDENHFVGIFDATNSTRSRRDGILKECLDRKIKVLFLESICTDQVILNANYELKMKNEDYRGMARDKAWADFQSRIKAYDDIYETLDEQDAAVSYIKLINTGVQVVTNRISGYMVSQITTFLPNLHISPKRIYLVRSGETSDLLARRIGGNAALTPNGVAFSEALKHFIVAQNENVTTELPLTIWTSSLKRAIETALPFKDVPHVVCYQTRLLNDIAAGACDRMTQDEVRAAYPIDFAARAANKLHFRFPAGGECYTDVLERVKPLILELERHRTSMLVISHQAVIRTLLAYFDEHSRVDMVNSLVPLHQVIQLSITAFGCDVCYINLSDTIVPTPRM